MTEGKTFCTERINLTYKKESPNLIRRLNVFISPRIFYFLRYFVKSIATATAMITPLITCCHIGDTLMNCKPY